MIKGFILITLKNLILQFKMWRELNNLSLTDMEKQKI